MRIVLALACLLLGADARAQHADDEAIALALFADGRQLAAQDDYPHACEKYEAAHHLEPWLGIELNLADCYEHVGKTASAWVLFHKASDEADTLADPRAAYARARAEKLAPALAHVTIQPQDRAQIRFDGKAVQAAEFGVPLPIDPGAYTIEATAPGHITWSREVAVAAAATVDVVIPRLEIERSPELPALPVPVSVRMRRGRSRLMFSLGGVGTAAVAASLALGLDAKLRYDDARGCDAQLVCNGSGYADVRAARERGDLATVVGGVGVVALAAAVFVYLRSPLVPLAGPSTLGLSVQGAL